MNLILVEKKERAVNELYEGLSSEAVEELQKRERPATIPAGAKLIEHGVAPADLVILQSGEVDIAVPAAATHVSLGSAGPGKVFGMRAVMTGELPEIDVTCLTACQVTLISQAEFKGLLQMYPNLYFSVARVLSADLKIADQLIRDCSRRPTVADRSKIARRM
jgi:CRP-like cAMP-binding protein